MKNKKVLILLGILSLTLLLTACSNKNKDIEVSENNTVEETLTEIETETESTRIINIFFPGDDSFSTGMIEVEMEEVTPENLYEQLKEAGVIDGDVLFSSFETVYPDEIVSSTDGKEVIEHGTRQIGYLDFSSALKSYLNKKNSQEEWAVLQSIANTYINAFDLTQIQITIDGDYIKTKNSAYTSEDFFTIETVRTFESTDMSVEDANSIVENILNLDGYSYNMINDSFSYDGEVYYYYNITGAEGDLNDKIIVKKSDGSAFTYFDNNLLYESNFHTLAKQRNENAQPINGEIVDTTTTKTLADATDLIKRMINLNGYSLELESENFSFRGNSYYKFNIKNNDITLEESILIPYGSGDSFVYYPDDTVEDIREHPFYEENAETVYLGEEGETLTEQETGTIEDSENTENLGEDSKTENSTEDLESTEE